MNVIFTCGGTGGHINPALAVAKLLRERKPGSNILFVGADDGMETDLVPREGFAIETLTVSNFLRSLRPKGRDAQRPRRRRDPSCISSCG